MATLEELYFNISWACRISPLKGTKEHLFLDNKIILELPESSKQCFASLSIY